MPCHAMPAIQVHCRRPTTISTEGQTIVYTIHSTYMLLFYILSIYYIYMLYSTRCWVCVVNAICDHVLVLFDRYAMHMHFGFIYIMPSLSNLTLTLPRMPVFGIQQAHQQDRETLYWFSFRFRYGSCLYAFSRYVCAFLCVFRLYVVAKGLF